MRDREGWRDIPAERFAGATVRVRHADYGCPCGCCGHEVTVIAPNGDNIWSYFDFTHGPDDLQGVADDIESSLGVERGADDIREDC